MGSLLLAFVAGTVTLLNPCVLPVLPIVIASSVNQSRFGPLALVAGLVLSFTLVGMLVLTVGFAIGLSQDALRMAAAWILIIAGFILTVPVAQTAFAAVTAPMVGRSNRWLGSVSGEAWHGQLAVGALLGIVWAPCVGPTLGVAIAAASQGQNLAGAALTFFVFGLGVALSLLVVASLSRRLLTGSGSRLRAISHWSKPILGLTLMVVGVAILTGLDKTIETALLEVLPDWLIRFTTRF